MTYLTSRLRAVFFWLCAALLMSCGGGSAPAPVAAVAPAVGAVLFTQSATAVVVNDPRNLDRYPHDAAFVVSFDLGALPITNDERGVGIVNDSWTAPAGSAPIKAVNLSWIPSVKTHPWASGEAAVCTHFTAAVPESFKQGSYANYTGGDLWFTDGSVGKPTSGKGIVVSGNFFFHNGAVPDGGPFDYIAPLNSVQFRASLGNSRLITTTAGELQQQPWSEPTRFGYCVTRAQMLYMLAAAAPMVDGLISIEDVVIDQALISNETSLGVASSQDRAATGSSLTSYFSDWSISIQGSP